MDLEKSSPYETVGLSFHSNCSRIWSKGFFWFDDWLEMGKLYDITGATCTCYLGMRRGARVSEAVTQGQWRVRGQRSRHFQDLHAKIKLCMVHR